MAKKSKSPSISNKDFMSTPMAMCPPPTKKKTTKRKKK